MSEPIPESVPTSVSNRSHRPTKKRALTPSSQQSAQIDALFANPDRANDVTLVGPKQRTLQAAPEIVANVQGSSAGAGSGEFHVYKASRRREYERLRAMDDEVKAEEAEKEFRERKAELERKDQEKLDKNRAKREKAKARQQKKKKQGTANVTETGDESQDSAQHTDEIKRKLGPAKIASSAKEDTIKGLPHSASHGDNPEVEVGTGITIMDDD